MEKFINLARLLLSIFPMILQAVRMVEEAMPDSGKGAAKLAMIRELIEAAYTTSGSVLGAFGEIWPAIERVVASVVAAYNAAGIFRKG